MTDHTGIAASAGLVGVEARVVRVEAVASVSPGGLRIDGLSPSAAREAHIRVLSALRRLSRDVGSVDVTVAAESSVIRGPGLDLPITLAILAARGIVPRDALAGFVVAGELALDGRTRPIRGALPMALAAKAERRSLIVPAQNAAEAATVPGLVVYPVHTLAEAVAFLRGESEITPATVTDHGPEPAGPDAPDFAQVRGLTAARRALEVAAAGGHNVLLVGPPGTGKTLLARRLPGILPPMTDDETIETTRVWSVVGLLREGRALVTARPFRAPHHSVSDAGLFGGGGRSARPGEVSLAHNGVLFLDELPEFRRTALEWLGRPLAGNLPGRALLVAAMNPCPCGYAGSAFRLCDCSDAQRARYSARVAPFIERRIDIVVRLDAAPGLASDNGLASESSAAIQARVVAARALRGETEIRRSSALLAQAAADRDRVLRVAGTIARLDGSTSVGQVHVAEAVTYRSGL